jgi:hypothetical protein
MIETTILSVLAETLYRECSLFARITSGIMRIGNGISMKCSAGSAVTENNRESAALNGKLLNLLRVTFFVRHSSDRIAADTVFKIAHAVRRIGYNAAAKGFPAETFFVATPESPSLSGGNETESIYSVSADIYYFDTDETPVNPDNPVIPANYVMLKFNGVLIPNVVTYNAVLKTRGAKITYNANGDMLTDLLPRKYHITAHLEKLSRTQLSGIYSLTEENEFFTVTFLAPNGIQDKVFFLEEKPAEIDFIHGEECYYKDLKLELEEK